MDRETLSGCPLRRQTRRSTNTAAGVANARARHASVPSGSENSKRSAYAPTTRISPRYTASRTTMRPTAPTPAAPHPRPRGVDIMPGVSAVAQRTPSGRSRTPLPSAQPVKKSIDILRVVPPQALAELDSREDHRRREASVESVGYLRQLPVYVLGPVAPESFPETRSANLVTGHDHQRRPDPHARVVPDWCVRQASADSSGSPDTRGPSDPERSGPRTACSAGARLSALSDGWDVPVERCGECRHLVCRPVAVGQWQPER